MRAALLAAAALLASFQDKDDCDLKKVVDAWECRKCAALLEKDAVDKDGKCTACKTPAEKVKACEKVYYVADCCKTRHASPGKCCGKDYAAKVVRAKVAWGCKACGADGAEGGKCAKDGCRSRGKAFEMKCSRSGEFPHGGQP